MNVFVATVALSVQLASILMHKMVPSVGGWARNPMLGVNYISSIRCSGSQVDDGGGWGEDRPQNQSAPVL